MRIPLNPTNFSCPRPCDRSEIRITSKRKSIVEVGVGEGDRKNTTAHSSIHKTVYLLDQTEKY